MEENVDGRLDILNDSTCRELLKATSQETLSASEIADRCDIPLSTTYRKFETLTETGLVRRGIVIGGTVWRSAACRSD